MRSTCDRRPGAAWAQIKASGTAALIVEQKVRASLSLADRGYLLEAGRIVGEGRASALLTDPTVQHALLGGATSEIH